MRCDAKFHSSLSSCCGVRSTVSGGSGAFLFGGGRLDGRSFGTRESCDINGVGFWRFLGSFGFGIDSGDSHCDSSSTSSTGGSSLASFAYIAGSGGSA